MQALEQIYTHHFSRLDRFCRSDTFKGREERKREQSYSMAYRKGVFGVLLWFSVLLPVNVHDCSSTSRTSVTIRHGQSIDGIIITMNVAILSARYAPCEGRVTTNHHNTNNNNNVNIGIDDLTNAIASTRNVTLQVRALLDLALRREHQQQQHHETTHHQHDQHDMTPLTHRNRIVILDERYNSMNVMFGDPIPGTSKRLYIKYTFDGPLVHTASFAEHEEVCLTKRYYVYDGDHRNDDFNNDDDDNNDDNNDDDKNNASDKQDSSSITHHQQPTITPAAAAAVAREHRPHNDQVGGGGGARRTFSSPTVSEMVLPYVMVFLELRERVRCRTVCTAWRNIIRERGVAVRIDDSDPVTFPRTGTTRIVLVGLLRHSHSSLQALVLSGTPSVTPADLHPALPHLRRLRSLDLSRCAQLGDMTLHLLATCTTRDTLQVLYLKGPLPLVTGAGLQDVVQACHHLHVLDISYLTQLGNDSMAAIGRHLPQLRSLFLRDNYQITNDSVAVDRVNQSLEQLTLWGCTGLQQLRLGSADTLAVVNLWGCHSLRDDAAHAFRGFAALRSLNMAECHRLTDEFVVRGGGGGWCGGVALPRTHTWYIVLQFRFVN
jgi:F-box domain